ncbi:MAG: D-2-hydroxyacid dehydrogenase [Deltaproteobacteria bacterium]|nr:D-2-hydroxyacid dehydrogenase [Deltaproteobacteria bacterium]
MKILLWVEFGRTEMARAIEEVPGTELVRIQDADHLRAELPGAEVLVTMSKQYDRAVAEALISLGGRLRWMQVLTTGFERITLHGAPPGVVVTNAGDAFSPFVADHAMALLLGVARKLPEAVRGQTGKEWQPRLAKEVRGLLGGTLAVVGFGSIGREIARRARAFGMRVLGVSRSAEPHPEADEVHAIGDLHAVLARADAVVLAVPHTKETTRLIGEPELRACRPHTILVNVARGSVVDQKALERALREGWIGGAGLDVVTPEPLPPDDPLWDCPNLLLTPHVAGFGPGILDRLATLLQENLRRYAAGEPLRFVVQP